MVSPSIYLSKLKLSKKVLLGKHRQERPWEQIVLVLPGCSQSLSLLPLCLSYGLHSPHTGNTFIDNLSIWRLSYHLHLLSVLGGHIHKGIQPEPCPSLAMR